ncbi:AMP-binding protein [Streptomyces lancefieldiae]|uniref:AMP-binding protein n=1 Tax=Streptomyces lancefieldiae TaxID=3075520 RepID=A0ABU3B1D4_9ACTN|nr:AMP-binding protein [Streptomyces sp. DSM 40712]MDT0616064.1 AMP-binding protein [Streptomyces sp. DSM 40712]
MEGTTEHGLPGRFLRGLSRAPEGAAVRVVGAEAETLSYARMHRAALEWGGALAGSGARTVAVLAGRNGTGYTGLLAALYAGAAVVPLRPDFPPARVRQTLAASGADVLLVDRAGAAMLPEVLQGRTDLPVLAPGTAGDGVPGGVRALFPSSATALEEPARVGPGDTAVLLFTSGSTGRPKGVALTHGGLGHYFDVVDRRYGFGPSDVFSQTFDLNFDCAFFDLFCAWGAGGTATPIPPHAYRDLPGFVAAQGMTVWFSTPSVIGLVRRLNGLSGSALPGLRWSLFAGEALTCRDAQDWQRAAPASTLENLYGPTELTLTITAHRWTGERSLAAAVNGLAPIGTVHPGHEHVLLGPDGEPSGAEEGELCVSGPQLAAGYLDPRDEGGRFVERGGRRWYRTGDRVRRAADGELVYVGRLDSQVQVHGWRVEPAEVEQAVRACGPQDAVAVGVTGDDGTELVVYYTGEAMAAPELVRRLRSHLPDGLLPRHFHHLAEFPLNANRKTDRLRLAADAEALLTSAAG